MARIIMYDLISFIWKIIGWNMHKSTKLMNFMMFFIFVLLIVTVILGILVPILEEVNTNTLADAFEIVGPYSQVIVKILITKYSMNEVNNLLIVMKNSFWSIDKFDKGLEKQLLLIELYVTNFFKIFIYTAYVCCTVIVLRPWFLENSIYPLTIYNLFDKNDIKQYLFMYTWQICNFIFGATALLAIDGIYIMFIINIYCQLKMIKYAFYNLKIHKIKSHNDEEIIYNKLKLYVDHHNIILRCRILCLKTLTNKLQKSDDTCNSPMYKFKTDTRFIQDVTKLFSLQILNQFLGNTASICMGVYIATEAGAQEFSAALKAVTIISVFLLELVLFCTAGTLITETCLNINDAMWMSGWNAFYSKRLYYATQMIIMRSQKRECLRAGKMYDIDLTSLAAILKTSVSMYTLMNNVKNKEL